MLVAALLLKLIPLYILVALGWAAGRMLGVGSHEIGRVLLFFLSPAVIFRGFYRAELDAALLAVPVAVFVLACLIAWLTLTAARRRWQDGRERILAFSAGTGNTGYFGIPACLTIIGPESLPYVVLVSFGAVAYEVSFGYYLVARSRAAAGEAVKRVLAYPGLHACWLGLAFNAAGIGLPDFATETLDILTGAYSPLGMMIVGLGLAGLRAGSVDIAFAGSTFAAKFLLWPALALSFVAIDRAALGLFGPTMHLVLVVESLVPMAAITVVHASLQQVHPEKASLAVGASTVFALLYLPAVLTLAYPLIGD